MGVQVYDLRGMTVLASKVVADNLTLDADVTIGDDLTVTDDLTVSGDAAVTGGLTITGSVTMPAAGVPLAGVMVSEARTATADGLTTGAITAFTAARKFVTVTSAGATDAITLPAAAAGTVGQEIDIFVGANGYELLTPATSGNTINTVDSDGTNQLDVAANTLLRCIQVSATGWFAYQLTATTITVVAPDND